MAPAAARPVAKKRVSVAKIEDEPSRKCFRVRFPDAPPRASVTNQEIESRLLAEFAPKLVKVVFNDGSSPVKTQASEEPFVSFAVDEGKRLEQEFAVFEVKLSKY